MILPKISVVTPSYNQGEFLEETIQSVLGQGYPNLQYVLVDGGSTDASTDIIAKYKDSFHYCVSEKDEGHGHALNKGFSHTDGEIMAWINSDDKYTPWSLAVVAEIFGLFPQVNWIVGFNAWWNSRGAMTHAQRKPKNIYDYLLGHYAWIQQESVFWRRSLWEKAGGYVNQDYQFMVDGELWSRFFLHDELYSVDCILGGYRSHSGNRAEHNYQSCLREMDRAVLAMKQECPPQVLDTYARLKRIDRLKDMRLVRHLPVSRLGRNLVFPEAFEAARYRNIFHDESGWAERELPFSL